MIRTLLGGLVCLAGLATLLVPMHYPDIGIVGHALAGIVGGGLTLVGASHV